MQTETLWRSFDQSAEVGHDRYEMIAFGDDPSMATELGALVVTGRKRATATLLRDVERGGTPLPAPGDHFLVVDGTGAGLCVCRTTEVRIGPLASVDARFAFDEGEGDRSPAWWLAAHRAFFARQASAGGFIMTDDEAVTFERLVMVWPVESHSPERA